MNVAAPPLNHKVEWCAGCLHVCWLLTCLAAMRLAGIQTAACMMRLTWNANAATLLQFCWSQPQCAQSQKPHCSDDTPKLASAIPTSAACHFCLWHSEAAFHALVSVLQAAVWKPNFQSPFKVYCMGINFETLFPCMNFLFPPQSTPHGILTHQHCIALHCIALHCRAGQLALTSHAMHCLAVKFPIRHCRLLF